MCFSQAQSEGSVPGPKGPSSPPSLLLHVQGPLRAEQTKEEEPNDSLKPLGPQTLTHSDTADASKEQQAWPSPGDSCDVANFAIQIMHADTQAALESCKDQTSSSSALNCCCCNPFV